jgi:hypothetical protein
VAPSRVWSSFGDVTLSPGLRKDSSLIIGNRRVGASQVSQQASVSARGVPPAWELAAWEMVVPRRRPASSSSSSSSAPPPPPRVVHMGAARLVLHPDAPLRDVQEAAPNTDAQVRRRPPPAYPIPNLKAKG